MLQARATTGEPVRPPTFDPRKVDRMDDAELDELPFGVLCLDTNGTILRYNLAESTMARLDRNDVIGRDFFTEVAPCARTDAFEGRFRRHVQAGSQELVRFPYLFDFKFGAQHVDIELFSVPGSRRHYLLVNRVQIGPARQDREGREPAPEQRDLVPEEDEIGVRRNARGQRVLEAGMPFVEALLRTADRLPPGTFDVFAHDWGVQWGRRAMVELEARSLEATGLALRERAVEEVAEAVHAFLRDAGWGELTFDFEAAPRGVVVGRLHHALLVEAARGEGRRCALVAGFLEAVFTHLAARRLHAAEVSCRGEGASCCELVVVGPARHRRLVEGLDERRSAAEWIELLARSTDV